MKYAVSRMKMPHARESATSLLSCENCTYGYGFLLLLLFIYFSFFIFFLPKYFLSRGNNNNDHSIVRMLVCWLHFVVLFVFILAFDHF